MIRFMWCFGCAFRGIWTALRSERNFRLHVIAAVVAVALGLYLELSLAAWGLVIFAIGFVMASELFNTAVERLSDEVSGGTHKAAVRNVKDISAAAVLLSALTALVIGVLFLLVPLIHRISELFQGR